MADIKPGQYRAKAIKNSVQLGETDSGNLQVAVDMDLRGPQGASIGQMTTFLYFSPGAAPYSYERLRAIGWKGQGPEDIDNLDGIGEPEVDVRVTVPEQYKATDGTMKMGSSKLEILTGPGKVVLAKPLDSATFKARLKALGGAGGTPVAGGSSGGAPPPPF